MTRFNSRHISNPMLNEDGLWRWFDVSYELSCPYVNEEDALKDLLLHQQSVNQEEQ